MYDAFRGRRGRKAPDGTSEGTVSRFTSGRLPNGDTSRSGPSASWMSTGKWVSLIKRREYYGIDRPDGSEPSFVSFCSLSLFLFLIRCNIPISLPWILATVIIIDRRVDELNWNEATENEQILTIKLKLLKSSRDRFIIRFERCRDILFFCTLKKK